MSKSLPVKYLKEIFQIRVPEEGVLTGETLKGQPFLNRHMYTPSKTAVNKKKKSSQRFVFLCLEPMVQLENWKNERFKFSHFMRTDAQITCTSQNLFEKMVPLLHTQSYWLRKWKLLALSFPYLSTTLR